MHFLCEARQLGFNRLEEVQRRLQNMRFSMEGHGPKSELTPGSCKFCCADTGRRGLRRPVRNAASFQRFRDFKLLHRLLSWAQESPALLLPSAPAEQNPPFEEENARKTWPSRVLS